MGKISKMSGTAWHLTQIKTEEEKQMRRGKCKFFDRKKTICRCKISPKYLLTCLTAARCDYYEEGKFVKEPNCNPFKEDLKINKDNKKSKVSMINTEDDKKSKVDMITTKGNKKSKANKINIESDEKSKAIIPKRISIKTGICVGDIVDIEAVNGCRIKKTFKMLDKNSNGKYNEITEACLDKKVNQFIIYKKVRYMIKNVERAEK